MLWENVMPGRPRSSSLHARLCQATARRAPGTCKSACISLKVSQPFRNFTAYLFITRHGLDPHKARMKWVFPSPCLVSQHPEAFCFSVTLRTTVCSFPARARLLTQHALSGEGLLHPKHFGMFSAHRSTN